MTLMKNITKPNPNVWDFLRDTERPIILYGTGDGADKVLNELERLSVPVQGVMASDDFVRGQSFRGFTVKSLSEHLKNYSDPIIIIAFGSIFKNSTAFF